MDVHLPSIRSNFVKHDEANKRHVPVGWLTGQVLEPSMNPSESSLSEQRSDIETDKIMLRRLTGINDEGADSTFATVL